MMDRILYTERKLQRTKGSHRPHVMETSSDWYMSQGFPKLSLRAFAGSLINEAEMLLMRKEITQTAVKLVLFP